MLKKLQALFPTAISTNNLSPFLDPNYYWFKDNSEDHHSLGIRKIELSEEQYQLLCTLFELINPQQPFLSGPANEWYSFLFEDGKLSLSNKPYRIIQLQISEQGQSIQEIELAIREYFHNCIAFIWIDEKNAIIVEEKTDTSYREDDIESISITLENEFYIKPLIYIGKFIELSMLKEVFSLEREVFMTAPIHLYKERVFTFEKILPVIMASSLPEVPFTLLKNNISQLLKEDPDLLQTLEVFLECNANASLAAKKLYVHRNTIQYRLDRFTEKTGLSLKDFHNTLTVYLACQLTKTLE